MYLLLVQKRFSFSLLLKTIQWEEVYRHRVIFPQHFEIIVLSLYDCQHNKCILSQLNFFSIINTLSFLLWCPKTFFLSLVFCILVAMCLLLHFICFIQQGTWCIFSLKIHVFTLTLEILKPFSLQILMHSIISLQNSLRYMLDLLIIPFISYNISFVFSIFLMCILCNTQ